MSSGYRGKAKRFFLELFHLFFVLDFGSFFLFLYFVIVSTPSILKRKNLSAPHAQMYGRRCTFTVFGRKIQLGGEWLGYAAEVYARKVYFPASDFVPRPGKWCVDLGASGGIYSLLAGALGGKVIAIEASKSSFEALCKNVQLNQLEESITPIWGVVGAYQGSEDVPHISMLRLLDEYKIERCDFLKCDIEGSEFSLLLRDNQWLSLVDYISMEVHTPFGEAKELVETLQGFGFDTWLADVNLVRVKEIVDEAGYIFARRVK